MPRLADATVYIAEFVPIVAQLDDAFSAFQVERARIVHDYGSAASTAPAFKAFAAKVAELDAQVAATYPPLRADVIHALRVNRERDSAQMPYLVYRSVLASYAALLPFLTNDQLIGELREAVEDKRIGDARALREITLLKINKPSAEVQSLQARAYEVGVPEAVRTSAGWVASVESSYAAYGAKRADYTARVAALETEPEAEVAVAS